MSLEIYKRKGKWWARGRIEYGGAAISGYIRQSTGASEEAGAWQWCREEEKRVVNQRRKPLRHRGDRFCKSYYFWQSTLADARDFQQPWY